MVMAASPQLFFAAPIQSQKHSFGNGLLSQTFLGLRKISASDAAGTGGVTDQGCEGLRDEGCLLLCGITPQGTWVQGTPLSLPQASLGGLSCLEGDSSWEEGRNRLCHIQTCALNDNLGSNLALTGAP